MALTTRQRRPVPSDQQLPPSPYTKLDKPSGSTSGGADGGLGWGLPLFALGMLRYMSATSNIIHDCDEVFNYWEPLHYLLYKSGFQTWEYRLLSFSLSFPILSSLPSEIVHLVGLISQNFVSKQLFCF